MRFVFIVGRASLPLIYSVFAIGRSEVNRHGQRNPTINCNFTLLFYFAIQGGQYVITLMDTHAAPVALIFICFVEAIGVSWFYGR